MKRSVSGIDAACTKDVLSGALRAGPVSELVFGYIIRWLASGPWLDSSGPFVVSFTLMFSLARFSHLLRVDLAVYVSMFS